MARRFQGNVVAPGERGDLNGPFGYPGIIRIQRSLQVIGSRDIKPPPLAGDFTQQDVEQQFLGQGLLLRLR